MLHSRCSLAALWCFPEQREVWTEPFLITQLWDLASLGILTTSPQEKGRREKRRPSLQATWKPTFVFGTLSGTM